MKSLLVLALMGQSPQSLPTPQGLEAPRAIVAAPQAQAVPVRLEERRTVELDLPRLRWPLRVRREPVAVIATPAPSALRVEPQAQVTWIYPQAQAPVQQPVYAAPPAPSKAPGALVAASKAAPPDGQGALIDAIRDLQSEVRALRESRAADDAPLPPLPRNPDPIRLPKEGEPQTSLPVAARIAA